MILPTIRDANGNVIFEGVTLIDPMDISILKCMINCTVGGPASLPSGYTIPAPPPGKVWHQR